MNFLRSRTCIVLALGLLSASVATAQEAAPAIRIVNRIEENHLVTLKGTVHPLANAQNDRGAASDDFPLERMHMVLKRSAGQEAALRQLIADMHTPGTASYHKWLTPDQFGKQFGPADEDVAAIETWLASHGLIVTKVSPGKQIIEFNGNVGQFRSAFHAQIHKYEVNGETHTANSSDPQIPEALTQVVSGFVSLNNFRPKSATKYLGKALYDPKSDRATPEWTIGSSATVYSFALAPADFAVQYDLKALHNAGVNGAGQTIAIINESNINVLQVNLFRTLMSLPASQPRVIIDGDDPGIDGVNNPDGPNYASSEAYIDVEWSGAVAPNATIDLVIAADTPLENGLFLAAERAVYGNIAPVLSMSFGSCESNLSTDNSFVNTLWEQAAAQGQTVMVSAGDNGSAGCDSDNTQDVAFNGQNVNGLASTPFNVAVGGTDFYYSDFNRSPSTLDAQLASYWSLTPSNNTPAVSIKRVIPEQPWNNSQYGLNLINIYAESGGAETSIAAASGGASSVYLSKPSWQSGKGVPNDGVRDLPDVSLFAANGVNASYYPVCASDGDCQPVSNTGTVQISGFGGTSVSAPAFAGMMALVNQKYGRQGQANFVLYPLAKQFPAAFHDVTVGTNTVPCDYTDRTTNCVPVPDPLVWEGITEGEIGHGKTADYNAGVGYDLASGLGTVDAYQLVTNWSKVKFASTTTTLTPSSTSFTHGAAINFSGAVKTASGMAAGDVALLTNSPEQGQQGQTWFTLSDGAYSGSVDYLPGGTYSIWGQYGGDSTNAQSTSSPVQIEVASEPSTDLFNVINVAIGQSGTPLVSGTRNIPYGTQLILDSQPLPTSYYTKCIATAHPPAVCATTLYAYPTGIVNFTDGAATINTADINIAGDAEYNGVFGIGSHSVASKYLGDNSYNASNSPAISFSIAKDVPILSANNPASLGGPTLQGGQEAFFPILVANSANFGDIFGYNTLFVNAAAAPTGTVTVTGLPGGRTSKATLKQEVDPGYLIPEGIATFSLPAIAAPGAYTLTVTYSGDANYASTSSPLTITLTAGHGLSSSTTAKLAGTISPTSSGATISGTVTGKTGHAAPTGVVYFISNDYILGAAPITREAGDRSTYSATLSSQDLYPGTNVITIQYAGDTIYNESAAVVSVANPLSDFSIQTEFGTVPLPAGGSGKVTINLASVNGFAGNVILSCAAAPGVTCSISPTAALAAGGTATATLTIDSPQNSPSASYDVTVTGKDSTGAFVHTLGVVALVSKSLAAVAHAYIQTSNGVSVYDVASSGELTLVSGSPFKTVGSMAGSNGKYFFSLGSDYVHSYGVASNGGIEDQRSEIDTESYKGSNCGTASGGAILDHTGQSLYVLHDDADYAGSGLCAAYQSFNVAKDSGKFAFNGAAVSYGRYSHLYNLPTFTGSDTYAYAQVTFDVYTQGLVGFKRQTNGALGSWNFAETDPAPQSPGWVYYTLIPVADPTNHLAVSLFSEFQPPYGTLGPIQLASYTVDGKGNIASTNNAKNMPVPDVYPTSMNMSPSGKVLAVAGNYANSGEGTPGLEVFHFNGAEPITPYSAALTTVPIDEIHWDNDNHLYALSNTTNKLYVYTITPTSITEAAGSPYTIASPKGLFVVPQQ